MNFKIPDSEIKSCLYKYRAGDKKSYSAIIELISPYIYNYPRVIFSSSSDCCGDFYEYILSRLDKILNLYRESDAKFITWFTIVLRNRYLNFVRERMSGDKVREHTDVLSLDQSSEGSPALYDLIGDGKNYLEQDKLNFDALIDGILRKLNERQRIFFHLYFIETLRPEDVSFLSISLQRPVREVLYGIDLLRNAMLKKYEVRGRVLDKLSALHEALLDNQKVSKNDEIILLRKKRERILEEYRRIKLNPSYESIAEVLQLPLGTVSTGIARMKKAVRNAIEEHYKEHYNEELQVQ
jgi:RNA polymerase sigma factor (sigma-70 family)